MAYLLAIGNDPTHRWRNQIPDSPFKLGRAVQDEWAVPWDPEISREHAHLEWVDGKLKVQCLDTAHNPIMLHGRSCEEAVLSLGGEFYIGRTLFRVVRQEDDAELQDPVIEDSTDPGPLTQYALHIADFRVELVERYSRRLWSSSTERDLASSLVAIIAEAVPHADSVAVLQLDGTESPASKPRIIKSDCRRTKDGRPVISRSMIKAAVKRSETILHIRDRTAESESSESWGRWGYCTPIKGESCRGWCLFLAGEFGEGRDFPRTITAEDLKGDISFTELIAQLAGAIRQVRLVEDKFSGIRQFFSPGVLGIVSADEKSSLAPTETETAILFCDLRGFSRQVEKSQDNLSQFFDLVSKALEAMTLNIINQDGVIADFQGDAALGFWGWPLPLSEGPLPACRAALRILHAFRHARESKTALSKFQVGSGISCGTAIAGKIGSMVQAKVGVFGPVVNLASRLQNMTKQIGVPILIDNTTAEAVRSNLPPQEGRCRRIGLVRPYGVERAEMVSELLPPLGSGSEITAENIENFESAVDAFINGAWDKSLDFLGCMPVKDRAKDFLLLFIASHNYEPPAGWDGVINLSSK